METQKTEEDDIEALELAIKEYDASSTKLTKTKPKQSSPRKKSNVTTSRLDEIDAALKVNYELDAKYKELENIFKKRLEDCRERVINLNSPEGYARPKSTLFDYHQCFPPYFKDKELSTPPDNNDTKTMNDCDMLNYYSLRPITGWSPRDRVFFLRVMLAMSKIKRRNQLQDEISEIKKISPLHEDLEEHLTLLVAELKSIQAKDLKSIAPPIGEEFDWETISVKCLHRHTPMEHKAMWRLFLHPSINQKEWSQIEHYELTEIAKKYNMHDWDNIAKELDTGRTGYQCFIFFKTNVAKHDNQVKWTEQEDEYLRRIVECCRVGDYIPWGRVAYFIEKRTKMQIYNRWTNSLKPLLKKGRFTPNEDAIILAAMKKHGKDYGKIATYIPGRTATQLRKRFNTSLCKQSSAVWSVDEDKKLLQLVDYSISASGKMDFSALSKHFSGKDRTNLRVRYVTLQNWLKKHPSKDIALAPRRPARRLPLRDGTTGSMDLKMALEQINNVSPERKTKLKLSKKSLPATLEYSLENYFVKEVAAEHFKKSSEVNFNQSIVKRHSLHISNVKKILLQLRAHLDKSLFQQDYKFTNYNQLQNENCGLHLFNGTTKTYLKRNPPSNTVDHEVPVRTSQYSIWDGRKFNLKNIMPPNLGTITACKTLMMKTNSKEVGRVTQSSKICHNTILKEHFNNLEERFEILFSWPMVLSNLGPMPSYFDGRPKEPVGNLSAPNNSLECISLPVITKEPSHPSPVIYSIPQPIQITYVPMPIQIVETTIATQVPQCNIVLQNNGDGTDHSRKRIRIISDEEVRGYKIIRKT